MIGFLTFVNQCQVKSKKSTKLTKVNQTRIINMMIFISQAKLSRKLGITKQGLAKLVNTRLKGAVYWRNKKRVIDLAHSLFKDYYKTKEQSLKKSYTEFIEDCKPDCLVLEWLRDIEQRKHNRYNIAV